MVATISESIINASWNNSSLSGGLLAALEELFGSPIATFTVSNIVYNVFKQVYNGSASHRTAYLVVGISSINNYIYWQLYDGFNTGDNQGTNGSQQQLIATLPSTSSAITLSIINGSELKCIVLQQPGWAINNSCIGLFRPSIISPSWNENNNLCAFLSASNAPFNFNEWLFSSNNPFGATGAGGSVWCGFQIDNTTGVCCFQNTEPNNSNQPTVNNNLLLTYPTQQGYLCGSVGYSNELAIAGGSFNLGDTWTASGTQTQVFTVVYDGSKPNFAVRTT